MKLKLLFCACIALVASCTLSPDEQARKTIETKLKKQLYFPDSYEHVETVLAQDSILSDNLLVPEVYKLFEEFKQLYEQSEKYTIEMNYAEERAAIYKTSDSDYDKVEYRRAQEEYEKYGNLLAGTQEKIESYIMPELQELRQNRHLVGSLYHISYRAKNNEGNTLLGGRMFLLNEDRTKVLASYSDLDSEVEELVAFAQKIISLGASQPKYTEE